ncbi:hypothetical protein PROFUN_07924 [Planoprotostelium fungivorum]|uniref:Uncharacterized protein n=1 Tax=Planoprotostelium fungivorum TaxID=1890364 RepID=A0A2P6NL32_9EUKA|nr:hypothetical protein PROFUN_07924 [Planoprotostelium fungivorum]
MKKAIAPVRIGPVGTKPEPQKKVEAPKSIVREEIEEEEETQFICNEDEEDIEEESFYSCSEDDEEKDLSDFITDSSVGEIYAADTDDDLGFEIPTLVIQLPSDGFEELVDFDDLKFELNEIEHEQILDEEIHDEESQEEEEILDEEAENEEEEILDEEDDPEPVEYDTNDLEDPFKQLQLETAIRQRNQGQKEKREKHMEDMFFQLTNGAPAPYITPKKFVKKSKQADTLKTPTTTQTPRITKTSLTTGLEESMGTMYITPQPTSLKRKQVRMQMDPANVQGVQQQLLQDLNSNVEEKAVATPVSGGNRRVAIVNLRLPSLVRCFDPSYRKLLVSVLGRHAESILSYDGDITYLIAALTRLGLFLFDYPSIWKRNINAPESDSSASSTPTSSDDVTPEGGKKDLPRLAAKLAWESGMLVQSFVDDRASNDETLRSAMKLWMDKVENTGHWFERRDNSRHKVVVILSQLVTLHLLRLPEEVLLTISQLPIEEYQQVSSVLAHFKEDSEIRLIFTSMQTMMSRPPQELSSAMSNSDMVQLPDGTRVSVSSILRENKQMKDREARLAKDIHMFYFQQYEQLWKRTHLSEESLEKSMLRVRELEKQNEVLKAQAKTVPVAAASVPPSHVAFQTEQQKRFHYYYGEVHKGRQYNSDGLLRIFGDEFKYISQQINATVSKSYVGMPNPVMMPSVPSLLAAGQLQPARPTQGHPTASQAAYQRPAGGQILAGTQSIHVQPTKQKGQVPNDKENFHPNRQNSSHNSELVLRWSLSPGRCAVTSAKAFTRSNVHPTFRTITSNRALPFLRQPNVLPVRSYSDVSQSTEEDGPETLQENVSAINLLTSKGITALDDTDRIILRHCCLSAAYRGHVPSQLLYATMCAQGVGGDTNPMEALTWYKAAASTDPSDTPISPSRQKKSGKFEEIIIEDEVEYARSRSRASYAVAVTYLTGSARQAFSSLVEKKSDSEYWDPERAPMIMEHGVLIERDGGGSFDFKKWIRRERKRGIELKKKRLSGREEKDIQVDVTQGMKYLKLSAESGYIEAIKTLAVIHTNGIPGKVDVDTKEAVKWLTVAGVDHGSDAAIYQLGCLYLAGSVDGEEMSTEESQRKGLGYVKQAAAKGNKDALHWIGHALHQGIEGIVERDVEEGISFLEAAAKEGHSPSMYYLACIYDSGDGVERDRRKFLHYLDMAAELEDADALFAYGDLYLNGETNRDEERTDPPYIEKDEKKALNYFSRSARTKNSGETSEVIQNSNFAPGGNLSALGSTISDQSMMTSSTSASAFLNEGAMYYQGVGTVVDYEKAFYAYQNALLIDPNHIGAMYNLASMYHEGLGVEKNEMMANNLLERAQQLEDAS